MVQAGPAERYQDQYGVFSSIPQKCPQYSQTVIDRFSTIVKLGNVVRTTQCERGHVGTTGEGTSGKFEACRSMDGLSIDRMDAGDRLHCIAHTVERSHLMLLTLGTVTYRMRFCDQQLHLNQQPVQAICDHQNRELLVQGSVPPEQLAKIVGESVARIWAYRFSRETAMQSLRHGESVAEWN